VVPIGFVVGGVAHERSGSYVRLVLGIFLGLCQRIQPPELGPKSTPSRS